MMVCTQRYLLVWWLLLCVYVHGLRPSAHAPCHDAQHQQRKRTAILSSSISLCGEKASSNNDELRAIRDQLNLLHRNGNNSGVVDVFLGAIRLKHSQHDDRGVYLTYAADRSSFNIGLQALLQSDKRQVAASILDDVTKAGQVLSPDTVHVLISDAFTRRDSHAAEQIYARYFRSGRVVPNLRSLNMMMEGHRVLGDEVRARSYFDMLDELNIVADVYSYSTLIRLARNGEEIDEIVKKAERDVKLTTPLLRCAIESLGKLGCPSMALSTALYYLQANDSVFVSPRSADTLLAALLAKESVSQPIFFSTASATANVTIAMQKAVEGMSSGDAALAIAGASSIKCGSRGYCIVFAYLHSLSSKGVDARDVLWKKLKLELHFSPPLAQRQQHSSLKARDVETDMLLNGRLCDALLRCYCNDVELAKRLWKTDLLPLAKRAEATRPGAMLEIAEKSLEALMFSSACCTRPDIGLEIAITARKRKWSKTNLMRLAKSYTLGKSRVGSKAATYYTEAVENSLFAELGFFEGQNNWSGMPKTIRIIMKEKEKQ